MSVTFLTNEDPIVRHDEQDLTEEQKAQARANIGAAAVGEGGGGGTADGAVLYTKQNLTAAQKAQARENIGVEVTIDGGTIAEEELAKITANMELQILGNLIDKDAVSDGLILNSGGVSADSRFCHTDFIKVTPGETLNFKVYSDAPAQDAMRYLAAYNESKKVQSSKGLSAAKNTYTVPDGIAYIKASIRVEDKDRAVLVVGELPEEYVTYVGEVYFATKKFIENVAYTKQETEDRIKKANTDITFEVRKDAHPDVPIPLTFEQGGIHTTTGIDTDSSNTDQLRAIGYITAKYGDEIKFTIANTGAVCRLYRYTADGAFIENTDRFWADSIFTAPEDCLYRISCDLKLATITIDELYGLFTITTAEYKRNGANNLNGSYVKETDEVIDAALDETAHIRLLCFADPHNLDDYKWHKYNEIMGRGVADYLVGLGDYVDYKDHGVKANYRRKVLNAINKAGREENRIYVTGNHDVSMKPGSIEGVSHIDLLMRPMECFDVFYRHLKNGIVVDPEKPYGCYFYIDDVPSKTRLIILNSSEIVHDDGTVVWYADQARISQRQLDWFSNTALKVDKDGWSVVVFLHDDHPYGFGEGCANVLFDILAAAKNGTSVNRTFTAYKRRVTDANGNPTSEMDTVNGDTYTINADFTNGNIVDVIGVLHGHTHEKDWREYNGIKSVCVRNDYGEHDDRYISVGTFVKGDAYYFTDINGNIYTFTAPNSSVTDNAVHFEYNAYLTKYGNSTVGYFVQTDGNQHSFAITPVSTAPEGATEITGFVRERDGSLAGEESCEIVCINKDTRTITTIPYGTGTRRVISY